MSTTPGPAEVGADEGIGRVTLAISLCRARVAVPELLVAERHAALREAFSYLPPRCQQLIALLIQGPPLSYAKISATLGIPVGSIGPDSGRCLDKLACPPVRGRCWVW